MATSSDPRGLFPSMRSLKRRHLASLCTLQKPSKQVQCHSPAVLFIPALLAAVWLFQGLVLFLPSLQQILCNIALVYATMENWEKAEEHLTLAMSMKSEPQHNKIDRAMEAVLVWRSRAHSPTGRGREIPLTAHPPFSRIKMQWQ